MKVKSIRVVPKRPQNIFVDREDARQAFWNVYKRVANDEGSVEAISYYGIGGIGKFQFYII